MWKIFKLKRYLTVRYSNYKKKLKSLIKKIRLHTCKPVGTGKELII